jgi:hypothetical protein
MDAGQLGQAALELTDLGGDAVFGQIIVVEPDDLLDCALALVEGLAQRQDFFDDERLAGEHPEPTQLAALNALGDGHFLLTGEQGHGAHLAQVHAHGIVDLFECARGEVELHLFRGCRLGCGRLLGCLLENLNAGLVEGRQHAVNFVGRMHRGRQQVVDLVVEQVAALFSHQHQLPDGIVLVFNRQLCPPGSCTKRKESERKSSLSFLFGCYNFPDSPDVSLSLPSHLRTHRQESQRGGPTRGGSGGGGGSGKGGRLRCKLLPNESSG